MSTARFVQAYIFVDWEVVWLLILTKLCAEFYLRNIDFSVQFLTVLFNNGNIAVR